MTLFIAAPWLALIPAAVCFGLYRASRRSVTRTAGLVWALYAVYEYAMHRRWLCTGECNIRVDLFLIYPLLLILTVAAVAAAVRGTRS